jgi:hypothetical protein
MLRVLVDTAAVRPLADFLDHHRESLIKNANLERGIILATALLLCGCGRPKMRFLCSMLWMARVSLNENPSKSPGSYSSRFRPSRNEWFNEPNVRQTGRWQNGRDSAMLPQ